MKLVTDKKIDVKLVNVPLNAYDLDSIPCRWESANCGMVGVWPKVARHGFKVCIMPFKSNLTIFFNESDFFLEQKRTLVFMLYKKKFFAYFTIFLEYHDGQSHA